MVRDLTRGNPLRLILSFCVPLMAGQFFQQFYNMVDSIIVGKFAGTAELSAVGSTGALGFMVLGFVSGICTGFSIPIAQSFGAGDYKKMRSFFANAVYLTLTAAVLLTVITLSATRGMLELMNTPDDIIDMAYTYISTVFAGISAILFYNLSAAVMRAMGDSRTPLYLLIFSSLLNVALDLLFVVQFNMSVKGVAIATVIAQAASAVLAIVIIIRKFTVLRVEKDERKLDMRLCGKLLYIGIPMALQFSVTAVGSVMLQSAVNKLGSTVIAAVTVAGKIQLMLVMPTESIGLSMATYCGQNLGAKRVDRVSEGVHKGILIALSFCAVSAIIAYFFGGKIALLFLESTQTEVIASVSQFLRICSFFYPVLIVIFIYRNALQGLGYSIPAMLAGFFELVARGVMGYFIIPIYGFTAVCLANPAAWFAADVLLIPVYYYVYFRLKKKYPFPSENVTEVLSCEK